MSESPSFRLMCNSASVWMMSFLGHLIEHSCRKLSSGMKARVSSSCRKTQSVALASTWLWNESTEFLHKHLHTYACVIYSLHVTHGPLQCVWRDRTDKTIAYEPIRSLLDHD